MSFTKNKFYKITDLIQPEDIFKYPMPIEYGFKDINEIEETRIKCKKMKKYNDDITSYIPTGLILGFIIWIFVSVIMSGFDKEVSWYLIIIIAAIYLIWIILVRNLLYNVEELTKKQEIIRQYDKDLTKYSLISRDNSILKNITKDYENRIGPEQCKVLKNFLGKSYDDAMLISSVSFYYGSYNRMYKKSTIDDENVDVLIKKMLIPNCFIYSRDLYSSVLSFSFEFFYKAEIISKNKMIEYYNYLLDNYYDEMSSFDIYSIKMNLCKANDEDLSNKKNSKSKNRKIEKRYNTLKDKEIEALHTNSKDFLSASNSFVKQLGFNKWNDYINFIKSKINDNEVLNKIIFRKDNNTRIKIANSISNYIYGLDTFMDLMDFYNVYEVFPDELDDDNKNSIYKSYILEILIRRMANELARMNNYESWEKYEKDFLNKYNIKFYNLFDSVDFVSKKFNYDSFWNLYDNKNKINLKNLDNINVINNNSLEYNDDFEKYDEDLEDMYSEEEEYISFNETDAGNDKISEVEMNLGKEEKIDENDEFFKEEFEFSYAKVKEVLKKIGYNSYATFKKSVYNSKKIKRKKFESKELEIDYLVKALGYDNFEDFYYTNIEE